MADAYDFQIESMKFRLGITDQTPYVRTTAPFRKEQFDSSPTVGDQSLTGWWTRGQLSFHMGAGLTYYEVLDGEAVLNRFSASENVDVFAELGEVALSVQAQDIPASVDGFHGITRALPLRGSQIVACDSWGYAHFYASGTTTTFTTANDGTIIDEVAVHGIKWYMVTHGKKIERYSSATYQDTKYSHTEFIYRCVVAKDRFWIVDALGDLYVAALEPGGVLPVALSSPVCRFPRVVNGCISVTDGGGSVFMSTGTEDVYSLTPDTDGSVAVLTAPVTAARMPSGEYVVCVRAHMGVLLIATTSGVRFAVIDGAQLTVGPLVVEWYETSTQSIGATGSRMFVIGESYDPILDDINYVGYEFDISEALPDSPLKFPYRQFWWGAESNFVNGAWTGCGEMFSGRFMWAGDAFSTATYFQKDYNETDLYPTGYITTGYHRFGTLDSKRFQKVTVRAKGSGTVQVYQIEADGTETSLGTMNAADASGTFAFTTTDPVERMALKFVLTRDAVDTTAGPTLLGYQIKALPVPERQRILRVPLQLHDKITLRRKTRAGHVGKAFEDIAALEALEKNQAVVTFTDHRTGETGTAYIDQVDFQGQTPPSENTNGFAGIAYVTLRVLS